MKRLVTVTSTGSAAAAPDVVRIAVAVYAERPAVAEALAEATDLQHRVRSAVRENGLAGADIASTGSRVYPAYDPQGQGITGYRAEHSLVFTVRDVATVGSVVTAIAAAAGNGLIVNDISLSIADPAPLAERARAAAFAAATTKARQYADLAGVTLGSVVSVAEGGGGGGTFPGPRMAMAAGYAGRDMAVEPGEQNVGAEVTVTWELTTPD